MVTGNQPRWIIHPTTTLILSPIVPDAVITEYYYLDYCLYACQYTSVLQCKAVVYTSATNLCKMYNVTINTPGTSFERAPGQTYLELYQGNYI